MIKYVLAILLTLLAAPLRAAPSTQPAHWTHGLPTDKSFFPIAVWLQDPVFARAYRQANFNTYIGLHQGPTEEQLRKLRPSGMLLVCVQNDVGLAHKDDPMIVGWMQAPDEPDNAQRAASGFTGSIPPAEMIEKYERIRANDPTRPVFVNLGQGVANDEWVGHGTGFKPSDYPLYTQCADVIMFDCYPVANLVNAHGKHVPNGQDFLWFIPRGIERVRQWSGGKKDVWNHVECTRLNNPDAKATPEQVRAEVWMSLVHGSKGLVYYLHESTPKFSSHALLDDPPMLKAVTEINRQVLDLAPVLNSPEAPRAATVQSSTPQVPIDFTTRKYQGTTYIFAVGMRNQKTSGAVRVSGSNGNTVEVIGEKRTLRLARGQFKDEFEPYAVHLYKVR